MIEVKVSIAKLLAKIKINAWVEVKGDIILRWMIDQKNIFR
jgi:hypothetical protein